MTELVHRRPDWLLDPAPDTPEALALFFVRLLRDGHRGLPAHK